MIYTSGTDWAKKKVDWSGRNAVAAAIEWGERLLGAKDACLHGQWKTWQKKNCPFSLRTAELYMQLARHKMWALKLSRDNPDLPLAELARVAAHLDKQERQVNDRDKPTTPPDDGDSDGTDDFADVFAPDLGGSD